MSDMMDPGPWNDPANAKQVTGDVPAITSNVYCKCGQLESSPTHACILTQQRLRDALEWLYDKWENGTPCYEDADNTGVSLGNAFRLSAEEESAILALIPEKCTNPTLAIETKPQSRKCHANMYSDPPQDCDAPFCGCDPAWSTCIEMLQECGWESPESLKAMGLERTKNGWASAQKASAHADEPSVMGAAGFPPPMPTPQDAIEAHIREIQILCDAANLDPAFYLSDNAAGGCF